MHGDDYASTGTLKEMHWMKGHLENWFDTKTTIVGHGQESDVLREGKIIASIVLPAPAGSTSATNVTSRFLLKS